MKTKNFVLSMEEQFPFGEVENEISMGVSDGDHHYDQIDLDPPNDSKLITFQYADDLEKNFFNDNIFYSEQIEVKDEKLNEGIEYASTFQVQNQNQMISISEIPFEVMDVQNEVVIEGSNMTNDAYGEAMQNLLNSEMSQTELSEENFRKRKKMKLLIPDLTNSVHVPSVEKVRTS
ncbi:hypothetical protein Anas_10601 [Armadillidium nasatum]|uniref:Uncharacterized protein n=1 Tax=Armadillidium nasatum TaxID=96803 RepID=A0A5N5SNK4_9CRUS|nr:hypothetical protein Anas_10601 [Armadillidium nasatum]